MPFECRTKSAAADAPQEGIVNKFEVFSMLTGGAESIAFSTAMTNLAVTALIALFIWLIYKLTYSGVAYNRAFGMSIVMTAMVTAIIMMVIQSNLALSLGMVGALSIIRFRSAVKDPRDISYIFWSVAMGLAAGTGIHLLAICGSLALGVFVLVFTLLGHPRHTLMLILKGRGLDAEAVRDQVFRLTGRARLRMQDIAPNGTEFIYDVRLKKDMSGEAVAKALSGIAGVETVHLVAGSEEP